MRNPLITALIDTYNHELFIEDAINSVLSQDFSRSEIEILVVDDGSTDKTPEIVRKFAPLVRLIRKANGGQASAFNAGISQSCGTIVAFLDGDDWWAPGKLAAVAQVFATDVSVGLVGHGITEVYPSGHQRIEIPRQVCRFRLASIEAAKTFRLSRGFLGTSRMAYRKEILSRIGQVPETLKFEADEYLFTLAGLFSEVMILPKSLTFYRLHDSNLFQFTNGEPQAIRRKQKILAALAESLELKLMEYKVPSKIVRVILDCVEVEANLLRLSVDRGFPWETVLTELRAMRVFHSDASMQQHLFSCFRLVPALIFPSNTYYRWRSRLSGWAAYQNFRRKYFPFPVQSHVQRFEKPAP
jgi:glycosyltransferase involved in cell wall biosynthesis